MKWATHGTQRLRGHVNIPIGDTLALRFAGATTQRDGFDYNTVTDQNVNGRDLWSTRVGVLWEPTENFRANFLWERFREDDDRARTGKMLCTRGITPDSIEWTAPDGHGSLAPDPRLLDQDLHYARLHAEFPLTTTTPTVSRTGAASR